MENQPTNQEPKKFNAADEFARNGYKKSDFLQNDILYTALNAYNAISQIKRMLELDDDETAKLFADFAEHEAHKLIVQIAKEDIVRTAKQYNYNGNSAEFVSYVETYLQNKFNIDDVVI